MLPSLENMITTEQPDQEKRSKSVKLAWFFAAVAVLWYVVSMIVIWTQ